MVFSLWQENGNYHLNHKKHDKLRGCPLFPVLGKEVVMIAGFVQTVLTCTGNRKAFVRVVTVVAGARETKFLVSH